MIFGLLGDLSFDQRPSRLEQITAASSIWQDPGVTPAIFDHRRILLIDGNLQCRWRWRGGGGARRRSTPEAAAHRPATAHRPVRCRPMPPATAQRAAPGRAWRAVRARMAPTRSAGSGRCARCSRERARDPLAPRNLRRWAGRHADPPARSAGARRSGRRHHTKTGLWGHFPNGVTFDWEIFWTSGFV